MSIQHHPSDDLLAAYAAGSIPLSQALCIATHIEMCSVCRMSLQRLNQLGAYIFTQAQPAEISSELKQKVFEQLEDTSPIKPSMKYYCDSHGASEAKIDANIPRTLRQFIPKNYDSLNWQRISFSILRATLSKEPNGTEVSLLRIKPGGKGGRHTHMGNEFTLVLKGAFSDETGLFQAGDFVLRNHHQQHRPVATKDGECICLTVLEAPIQFTGYVTKWLNPLLRKGFLPSSNDRD